MAIGLGLILLSVVLAVGAWRFPPEMGFVILPAYVYPFAVAGFLGVVGVLLSYQAVSGGFRELDNEQAPAWRAARPARPGSPQV